MSSLNKKEHDYQEALNEYTYYRNMEIALDKAISKMEDDLRLCVKQKKKWSKKLETKD
jgi:hypothetical protein